ncbi:heme-dependent oxidative N-demethylase family protein [Nitratireductor alexandrii]|uniref:heme-dependent oxidative N-demethylase family protein n=1 Tax=Nitratireductor alexandrii TaxID=2448161 RepID=UPI000FDC0CFE|nr:DUF3445 domain-containing protein [Nitratireductor alexandrii]
MSRRAQPAHTPYDGTATPFTIGLKPLDLVRWLEIDGDYEAYLAEKRRLFDTAPDTVFAEEPETRAAQHEVLALVRDGLAAGFPALFPGTRQWEAALAAMERESDTDAPPLKTASLLVQEDLVLMRKGEAGWRLAAASLCFPSSWTLTEKFGRPIEDIHATVPGFGRGTRTAGLINRIFDNLKVEQPVERLNWSLQDDDDLHKPLSKTTRDARREREAAHSAGDDPLLRSFIRVERQTLRKLPVSGDILFTIRIFLDPMRILAAHPDRAALAGSLAAQLAALDAAQLAYKGLAADRERLVAALQKLAAA